MRRAARVDASQDAIVRMLRQCGMSVEPKLSRVGHGVPDLLVGWQGMTFLLETKTGSRDCDRKLTKDEQAWHESWGGQVSIVSTPDEAVQAVLGARKAVAGRLSKGERGAF